MSQQQTMAGLLGNAAVVVGLLVCWCPFAAGGAVPELVIEVAPAGDEEQVPALGVGRAHANGEVFPTPQPGAITLERIMSDPEWIADSPEAWHWSIGGDMVHYTQRRPGTELTNLVAHPIEGAPSVVPDERLHAVLDPGATGDIATSPDGTTRVVAKGGDLYLLDLKTSGVRQLTATSASESRPMYMRAGDAIAYTSDGDWFVRDMATGDLRQVADVLFSDVPKVPNDGELSFLEAQQLRYFETLSDRRAQRMARDARAKDLRLLDRSQPAGPYYLGNGLTLRGSWLSPSGRWLLVSASASAGDSPRDVMPRYVNDDGHVDTVRVRSKVGLQKFTTERLFMLDLLKGTHTEIDLAALPGITDLFNPNTVGAADPSDESPDAQVAAAVDPAATADQVRAPDAKDNPKPRMVGVLSASWSPEGSHAAVMLEARDNKDRWIVALTPGDELLTPVVVERLRDEAWINWRFNEMGWLSRTSVQRPTLWFLSERSGYSHLLTWSPGHESPTAITDGEFEISSVIESLAGGLFFLMNRDSPVVYNIGRLDPIARQPVITPVTALDGTVSRFELSPDGSRVLFEWSSAITPSELFIAPSDGSMPAERLTSTVSAAYSDMPWVVPELVPVPSSVHGRPIWTKVYRVPGSWSPEDGPRPGVMFVHGAGYTQNSDNQYPYYFREQMFHSMLAHLGYVVVDMDYRASSGYGRDWRTAIARHMGKSELEDLRDGVDWAVRTHGVDRERFGVYGGSYGGFMTLYAMFVDPQLFAAGASLRPVTDWAHYNHGYTSNILNTPQLDPEAYARSSPIELAEGLENPLLICHGMLDDNVVFQDTVRLAQRLIELEKEDWEVAIYPMEPHGFVHASAWLDEYRRIFKLFERYLCDRN